MPNPIVLVGNQTDYLYTGSHSYEPPNVPVRAFTDLGLLGAKSDAMPVLPSWSKGWIWAPDVLHVDGRYVMWFSTADVNDILPTGVPAQCIGEALSSSPLGPFKAAQRPVICGSWGYIDPRFFYAPNGQLWLDWKADLNASWGPAQNSQLPQNQPTVLWAQRLSPDGMTLEGDAHELIAATSTWEHKMIEAPDMVYADGGYYLFFSTNASYLDDAGIGEAVCRGPAGPCEETNGRAFLGASSLGVAPSEESLFTQDGMTWLLFSPSGIAFYRKFAVARIAFAPKGPYVAAFDGAFPGIEGLGRTVALRAPHHAQRVGG
jgi:hypothetical protein